MDDLASTISGTIASWCAALTPGDVTEPVRRAVADTILDTVCLSIAAVGTDYGIAVRGASADHGPCTVFGDAVSRDLYTAALINGTTGHGEDYDNTYEGCPVHTGVVIVPALFAAGEAYRLPASRVALGIAAGIEITCRLGATAEKGVHTAGFHPTSVLGTLGAAAGVAVALGQDPRQVRDALGLAGSMAAGIIEYLADGSWTKRLHAGWAAQSGLRAAALGGTGFFGPASVLEGTHGLFKAFAPTTRDPDFTALVDGLGTRWEAARLAFKPYACGTMNQPFIDCAVRLARRGVALDRIAEIVCRVGEGTVHRLWAPLELKQAPPTAYAAKFSGPYCVAAGLLFQDAGLAQFTEETVHDPRILALANKVRYEVDPDNEYPVNYTGEVEIRFADGTTAREFQPQLRGGVRDPLTHEELMAKGAANLRFGGWPSENIAALAGFADGVFEDQEPFSAMLLRGPA